MSRTIPIPDKYPLVQELATMGEAIKAGTAVADHRMVGQLGDFLGSLPTAEHGMYVEVRHGIPHVRVDHLNSNGLYKVLQRLGYAK